MIKPEELQVGLLVWWTRVNDGWGSSWDCPGVVSYVNNKENRFKVISFDDMKETNNSSGGLMITRDPNDDDNSLNEMKITSIDEVEKYFLKRTTKLGNKISEMNTKIRQMSREIEDCQKTIERIKAGNFMSYYQDRNSGRTIIT